MGGSRTFFTAQAGRDTRNPALPDDKEPWGTTSQSVYRSYEPAEMKNCRDAPTQKRPSMEAASTVGPRASGADQTWRRTREHYAEPPASAIAPSDHASNPDVPGHKLSAHALGRRLKQRDRESPMPERPYLGLQTEAQHREARASEDRLRHFPYRDEYHPRSKRLLYEMALEKCCRDSVRSASTQHDTVSCFTATSRASSMTRTSKASSTPSLQRVMTGDSKRIPEGVAKRRLQVNLRAPGQWPADEEWFKRKFKEEGPAGMSCANMPPFMLDANMAKHGERLVKCDKMFGGRVDHEARVPGGGE
eukprot:TRINITY_DN45572_c0_g1_i1.p1 TRINITY_DN45572_c0_g1~~TRINITY_DN45572_c0_g1_i1.p1  ORF type:complete len:324 (+),score=48.12 TRINITY_DN45572_c0_g1_i1:59-973(+)